MNLTGEPAARVVPALIDVPGCRTWYTCSCVLAALIIVYAALEFHYFLRFLLCVFTARFFKSRLHVLDQANVQGICVLNDVDVLLTHMNNARYVRELDFARVDFYERTGVFAAIRRRGGGVVQGACTIRYRKPLRTFSRYILTTKIVWWDEVSLFMEHRFLRHSDMFVLCIATCRQRITGDVNVFDMMRDLLGRPNGSGEPIGPQPRDLALWMESNAFSSAAIRADMDPCEPQLTHIDNHGGGLNQTHPKMDHPHLTNVMPAPNSTTPLIQVN